MHSEINFLKLFVRRAGCQATGSTESLALACDSCSYRCRLKVELLYHQAVEHPKQFVSGKLTERCVQLEYDHITDYDHLIRKTFVGDGGNVGR